MIFERNEIEERYTWDLSSMFENDEAFNAAFERAKALPEQSQAHEATATSSASGLLDYLKFVDDGTVLVSKLFNYAARRQDEDTRVSTYQAFLGRVTMLYAQVSTANAWFTPALIALDPQVLDGYFSQEPGLEVYRRKIESIVRLRPYTLPAEQEALLAAASEIAAQPEQINSMFNDADLTFGTALDAEGVEHQVTHGSFVTLLRSSDRVLRKNTFDALYSVYEKFRNTSSAILNSQIKQLEFFANARGYASTLEASMFPTEVPTQVYNNLINAVNAGMDTMYKYVDLRKSMLGVDELHSYDLYAPMVDSVEKKYTYEEACEIMYEALAPLGPEYVAQVKKGVESRWIDVYETPGKRSGAYSAGGYGMQPVILLNFQGTIDDVFTLVHEMGHSMHTFLACETQPPCYSEYEMFVAEVASTTNESLLMQWFLDHATDARERAWLLNHYLEEFRTTLFRQTMFAEFERDINQMSANGEGITADALCDAYGKIIEKYFGPGLAHDDYIALEWARIPHFYYDYYVYVYATSFSASVALARKILTEGAPAREAYINFLRGGSSKAPIDLLKGAGVDMSTAEPIEAAIQVFADTVEQLRELAREL
ncbi:MAG: oligoendopeptidase F [Coriobacteriales bacterium]|nr:oligoendopeptidase F [Coriobacteriales bacterium]